jgi:hypothetical protein
MSNMAPDGRAPRAVAPHRIAVDVNSTVPTSQVTRDVDDLESRRMLLIVDGGRGRRSAIHRPSHPPQATAVGGAAAPYLQQTNRDVMAQGQAGAEREWEWE